MTFLLGDSTINLEQALNTAARCPRGQRLIHCRIQPAMNKKSLIGEEPEGARLRLRF